MFLILLYLFIYFTEVVELKPEPPLFVERFEEQKVPSKGVIRLAAKVTGNPQPEIAWYRYVLIEATEKSLNNFK